MSGLLCSSLLVGCDSDDHVDEYGHERAAPTPEAMAIAEEEAIRESLEFEPSPDKFEYTGRIDDLDAPWRREPSRALDLASADEAEDGDDDPRADLVDILTRDGRTYRQRPGTEAIYASGTSRLDPDVDELAFGFDDDTPESESMSFRELITGNIDNRIREWNKHKQGVMVKVAGQSWSTGTTCSASMIGPRVFLTAAHCVTDDFGNFQWGAADWVMPAVRGASFSGNNNILDDTDTPWGARQVIRVVKPAEWDGNQTRYDYAVLIIGDEQPDNVGQIQWDPDPALFANQTCSQLLSNDVHLKGYPGATKTCADASIEDNFQCGGWAYTEYGPVDACLEHRLFYYHDSQEGQSGSPVYRYNESTGKRRVVGINRGTMGNRNFGPKISASVFSMLCDRIEAPNNQSSFFSNTYCP